MINIKKKHLHIFAALIPAFLVIGIFLFPYLLQTESDLIPLKFNIAAQTDGNGSITLQGSFNQDLPKHEVIWFYAENARIEIKAANIQLCFNERNDTPDMFRSPGSGWFSFPSPGIKAGESVEFTVCSYYNENEQAVRIFLEKLYIGDGSGLIGLMLEQLNFFSIVLICAVITGLIYIVEGTIDVALGMTSEAVRIVLLGFYCFSGGLRCVTDAFYPYLTLLISPPWAAGLLDMAGIMLFPIALSLLMLYYTRGKQTSRAMTYILFVAMVTILICITLQISGKADLLELELIIEGAALVSLGTAIVILLLELRSYRDIYLLLLFLTVFPVFISEIADGINNIWEFMPQHILMKSSFGLSILMLIFQFISYANTEIKKAETLGKMENELMESRVSIMFSQIKPHFLYNSLLGIKQLCDTNPQKASDALEHFSFYLRGNLYSVSDNKLILFNKELEHLKDYLYLEKMRFEERLIVEWEISFTDFLLPSLTLQPIVENAVRHGITKRDDGGTLIIRSERTADIVRITIMDNGIGFDMDAMPDTSRPHVGLQNVRKRLQIQCGGNLEIDSIPDKGTKVIITLPVKEAAYENTCGR